MPRPNGYCPAMSTVGQTAANARMAGVGARPPSRWASSANTPALPTTLATATAAWPSAAASG